MKTPLFLFSLLVLLLSSCAAPVQRRIQRNPELYAKLTEQEKQSVASGRIFEGMSKDAVFIVWGKPNRVSSGTRDGRQFERWSYTEYEPYYSPMFHGGFGVYGGCGYRDPYLMSPPVVEYVPTPGASVEFVNGKVSGFMVPKR